jgi:hypothetical protein
MKLSPSGIMLATAQDNLESDRQIIGQNALWSFFQALEISARKVPSPRKFSVKLSNAWKKPALPISNHRKRRTEKHRTEKVFLSFVFLSAIPVVLNPIKKEG